VCYESPWDVPVFERPLARKPSYVAAHLRLGALHARLILECLAMHLQLSGRPLPKAVPFTEDLQESRGRSLFPFG